MTGSSIGTLPKPLLRLLLTVRSGALHSLEPIDYVSRAINGKLRLPPLSLRRYAGPLAQLEASAGEFVAYLKILCNLTPQSRVLDIGCGFGLLALQLDDYISPSGRYVGVDISKRAVDWANKRIGRKNPQFTFVHLDIKNRAYHPAGKLTGDTVELPFAKQSFDLIVVKSVFTHLLPDELANYLSQIGKILSPGGVCLATFFLLNEQQGRLAAMGHNAVDFRYGDGVCRYSVREIPEFAVAYEEQHLLRLLLGNGLRIREKYYGTWSGQQDGLSYQDVLLLEHEPSEGRTPVHEPRQTKGQVRSVRRGARGQPGQNRPDSDD